MKRSNLLKVLSVIMVVAMLMMSTTTTFAAVTAEQNSTDTTIVIEGDLPGGTPYTEVVVRIYALTDLEDPESAVDTSKIVTVTQTKLLEDGSFICELPMSSALPFGWYAAKVRATHGEEETATFYFISTESKFGVLQEVIEETVANGEGGQKENLENYKNVLGFNIDLWDQLAGVAGSDLQLAAASAVIDNLEQWRGTTYTIDILPQVITEINRELYVQALNGSIITDISDIGNYIDADQFIEEMNKEDSKISADGIQKIKDSLVGGNFANSQALEDHLKQQVVISGVMTPALSGAGDTGLDNAKYFIDTYGSAIGLSSFSTYNTLTSTQKRNIVTDVKASGVTTFAEFDAKFTEAVNTYRGSTNPGTNPSNPGGNPGGPGNSGTIIVTPTATPTPTPNANFSDIEDIVWAHEAIRELSSRKIFEGYGDGTFGPNNPVLREEFIKITVVGLYGADAIDMSAVPSYTDAQSDWYAPYVAAAEKNNITSGIGDGLFGTGMMITRQDMALMLYRMLRDAGLDVSTAEYDFTDKDQIADYARDAVFALKNMGIINGYDDGSFQPEGSTTRAEAAVLLYNTLDKLGKIIR